MCNSLGHVFLTLSHCRWTGFSDKRRLLSEDAQTECHRHRSDVVQGQEAAEDDSGDIRVVRHVLPADHRQQNAAQTGRPARAEHRRVRAHLPHHVHQPDHLRGDELRVPTGVQKPLDVQELTGTAAKPQGCDQKAVRSLNRCARFGSHV